MINELISASEVFFMPVLEVAEGKVYPVRVTSNGIITEARQGDRCKLQMALMSEKVRRVIDFSKLLSRFASLSENDQIALIKGERDCTKSIQTLMSYHIGCAWEVACLRSLLNFDPETETFGPNQFGDYYSMHISECLATATVSTQLTLRLVTLRHTLHNNLLQFSRYRRSRMVFGPQTDSLTDRLFIIHADTCRCTRHGNCDGNSRSLQDNSFWVCYFKVHYVSNSQFSYLLLRSTPSKAKARYTYNLCMQKLDELIALNEAKAHVMQTYARCANVDPLLTGALIR